jgi:probable rRNA maturation factor
MPLHILTNRLSEWPFAPTFDARVTRAAAKAILVDGPREGEVSVTFVGVTEIQSLNREYLGHDRPTDVIAFELGSGESLVGDVYICPEVAAKNAADRGGDLSTEVLRLVIHGSLHLVGYEHPEGPERESSRMYGLQEELLQALADD